MKRPILVVLGALALVLTTLTPAHATIGFSQQVRLVSDPTNSTGISVDYSSFSDGASDCSWQGGGGSTQCYRSIGGGTLRIVPKTYRLVESVRTKDYYLIDLTVSNSGVYGSKDYAWFDATITARGSTRILGATYSNGVGDRDECKTYPVDIAAGWGPLSVGTTVGSFTVNCHRSSIKRTAVSGGNEYHVTNLNAVKNATFQRFVVVPRGAKPSFTWSVQYAYDTCVNGTVSTGSGSQPYRVCRNGNKTVTRAIGT